MAWHIQPGKQQHTGGGTAMFGLLALAGDVGCAAGPGVVGIMSGFFGGEMKAGLLAAAAFPALLLLLVPFLGRKSPTPDKK